MVTKRGTYRTGRERIERILDAAHDLFIRGGYRTTSLRDIAAAAGISHPALLRYFSSRAEILTALVERLDQRSGAAWEAKGWTAEHPPPAADIARANEEIPGWTALFTALLGEATSAEHPGHALMVARRAMTRDLGVTSLTRLGLRPADAGRELTRLVAGWDGLQILSLYFPGEIDIPAHLEQDEALAVKSADGDGATAPSVPGAAPARTPDSATSDVSDASDAPDVSGPGASGTLAAVVTAASHLYALHGYYETSVQAVADEAGITRAALVHLAPTKQALLDLVLTTLVAEADTEPWARHLTARPRWRTAAEAVLVCEATVPSHPAHAFMTDRLATARRGLTAHLAELGVPDAAKAADWVVAVGLGVMIAWLYDPEGVDPDAALDPVTILAAHTPARGAEARAASH
jgi:AcrR family transcriptional regulator